MIDLPPRQSSDASATESTTVSTTEAAGRVDGARGLLGLRLRVKASDAGERTIADITEQAPPLRMIRAFQQADGGALVHLHNVSGGVLGGDQLTVTAQVEAGARAQLTTTGATRVYRARVGYAPARQSTHCTVASGALLEYLPDPLIPYADARYHQTTRFDLSGDGGLFAWDIVTPGREARGEAFAYEELRLESRVTVNALPIALEQMTLRPHEQVMDSPVRLGRYRTFATLLVCRGGQTAATWSALEQSLARLAAEMSVRPSVIWAANTLTADGLMVRGLAVEGRHLLTGLPLFWRAAKRQLYGLDAIMPRKVY